MSFEKCSCDRNKIIIGLIFGGLLVGVIIGVVINVALKDKGKFKRFPEINFLAVIYDNRKSIT